MDAVKALTLSDKDVQEISTQAQLEGRELSIEEKKQSIVERIKAFLKITKVRSESPASGGPSGRVNSFRVESERCRGSYRLGPDHTLEISQQ